VTTPPSPSDSVSPERWARIEEQFHLALDHPTNQRDAFVARLAVVDPVVAGEVRSLLAAHQGRGLLDAIGESPTATLPPPQWVGPYRVLRELGHGGMGTVFLAERSGEGFTQIVALKLIRADYADPRLEAALASERRILARLEHPSIARFIDGGTTASGQPYVAMEHVAGVPLPRHCDEWRLSTRRRLALFVRICDGVQYAHGQLVVHSDLKPNNILVTEDGRPVLLDFGVARLLDESTPPPDGVTANWVTPAYAGPEQLRGQPATTLTDVYALGVILYEMLLGRLPYAVGDGSIARMVRAVCDEPAISPSDAARERGDTRLARALAGDIDTILLKALAKDPERRYGTVEQFAADVTRYLEGRPVLARPDTPTYRARKFILRHRASVGAGAALALTLIGGIGTTAWQASVARDERDRAREALAQSEDVTTFLLNLFESSDPRQAAGDTLAGRAILQRGLSRVEELSDQPVVQARLLDALGRVLASLGQYERAQQLVERGLALRRAALPPGHLDLAAGYRRLAEILRERGAYTRAESLYHDALGIERASLGADDPRLAETLGELGFLMPYLGRADAAESLYVESFDIRARRLGATDPLTLQSRLLVALRRRNRDPDGAEREMREILTARRRVLGEGHLDVAHTMLHLADLVLRTPAGLDEAERLYAGAVSIQRASLGDRDLILVHGLHGLADVRARRGDYRAAERRYREALDIRVALLGNDHPGAIESRDALVRALVGQRRFAEAESLKLEALEGIRRIYGTRHNTLAGSLTGVADLYEQKGDLRLAERYAREALEMREEILAPQHITIAVSRVTLARILERRGSVAEARQQARQALALLEQQVSPDNEWLTAAQGILQRLSADPPTSAATVVPTARRPE